MRTLSLVISFLIIVTAQAATLQLRDDGVSDSPRKLSKRDSVTMLPDIAVAKRLMGGLGAMSDMSGGSISKASATPATAAASPLTNSTNTTAQTSRMDNIRTLMGSGGAAEKLGAIVSLYKSIRGGSGSRNDASNDITASSGGSGTSAVSNNSTAISGGTGSIETSDNSTASSEGTEPIVASGNGTTNSDSGSFGASKKSTAGSGLAAPSSQRRHKLSLASNNLENHMKSKRRQSSCITIAQASSITRRDGACSKYYVVDTRGTGELQGPSVAFRGCNSQLKAKFPGLIEYHTMYPAGFTQISTQGTSDIVRYVNQMSSADPGACFLLEGYSQGAMATINALPKLTAKADVIKGVIVVGSPAHNGGVQRMMAPNTDSWKSKILDICAQGDPVCGMPTADGPAGAGHLSYPMNPRTQNEMAAFATKAFQSGSTSSGAAGSASCSTGTSSTSSGGKGATQKVKAGVKRLMGGMGGMGGMSALSGLGGGTTPNTNSDVSASNVASDCTPATSSSSTGSIGGSTPASGGLSALTGGGGGLSNLMGGGGGLSPLTGGSGGGSGGGMTGGLPALPGGAGGGSGGLSSLMSGGGLMGGSGGLPRLPGLGGTKRDGTFLHSSKARHGLIKRRRV